MLAKQKKVIEERQGWYDNLGNEEGQPLDHRIEGVAAWDTSNK